MTSSSRRCPSGRTSSSASKPVTAPPKKAKTGKYKYYAENFADEPFAGADSQPSKPKPKEQTPFNNVAERLASQGPDKPSAPSKPKKAFLVRGAGVGGGVGQKVASKDKPKQPDAQPKSTRSDDNGNPKQTHPGKQRQVKTQARKIFDSDSDDGQASDDSANSDLPPSRDDDAAYAKPAAAALMDSRHSEPDCGSDADADNEPARTPGVNADGAAIADRLLEHLPRKARDAIEDKLHKLRQSIAEQEQIRKQDHKRKLELQTRLAELRADVEEFEAAKQHELQELRSFQDDELKKIRKERKDFDRLLKDKQKSAGGNSKGKQDIDELRAKIDDVREDTRARDVKSNAAIEQLKAELDFYVAENDAIQKQIRQVERERLSQARDAKAQARPAKAVHIEPAKTRPVVERLADYDGRPDSADEQEDDAGRSDDGDSGDEDFLMAFPLKYHNDSAANTEPIGESRGNNGKVIRSFGNGKKEMLFSNGVRKTVFPDGYSIVYFNNQDIKQTFPDKKSVYYFAEADTTQTTYPDGLKVFRFGHGQVEKHYPDQTKEIW